MAAEADETAAHLADVASRQCYVLERAVGAIVVIAQISPFS
jgi:hypothetical protein